MITLETMACAAASRRAFLTAHSVGVTFHVRKPCNTKKDSCLYERVNDIQVTWLNMNVVFTWKRLCQYGYYMWRMRYSVLGAWVGLIKEMYRRITKDHMCALVHGNMGMDILVIEHDPMHLRSLPPLCWVKLDRIEEKGIYVHGWVLINLSPYVIGSYWCHARRVMLLSQIIWLWTNTKIVILNSSMEHCFTKLTLCTYFYLSVLSDHFAFLKIILWAQSPFRDGTFATTKLSTLNRERFYMLWLKFSVGGRGTVNVLAESIHLH